MTQQLPPLPPPPRQWPPQPVPAPPPQIPQQQQMPQPQIPQPQIPRQQIPQQYAPPGYGQAPYGAPPGPPTAYPPAPAPPRRRRTGLIVGVIVGVVVVVAGLVIGGLLLFGKSSLNTAQLQQDIRQLTQEKADVAATDVSCPQREIKAGDQFTCTAQLDGQSARFTVKQQDDKGNVHIQLDNSLVVVSQLQDLLTKQVSNDVGFQVTSSCQANGHSVLVDGIGKPVRCTVTDISDPGNSIDVMATVDDQGHVTYKEA